MQQKDHDINMPIHMIYSQISVLCLASTPPHFQKSAQNFLLEILFLKSPPPLNPTPPFLCRLIHAQLVNLQYKQRPIGFNHQIASTQPGPEDGQELKMGGSAFWVSEKELESAWSLRRKPERADIHA